MPADERTDEPDPRVLWRWIGDALRPWVGWILIGAGALCMLMGYLGVSREAIPAKQIPYLVSGGIGGIFLAVVGAYFLGTQEMRNDSGRLDRLERMVEDLHQALLTRADAPQSSNGSAAATAETPSRLLPARSSPCPGVRCSTAPSAPWPTARRPPSSRRRRPARRACVPARRARPSRRSRSRDHRNACTTSRSRCSASSTDASTRSRRRALWSPIKRRVCSTSPTLRLRSSLATSAGGSAACWVSRCSWSCPSCWSFVDPVLALVLERFVFRPLQHRKASSSEKLVAALGVTVALLAFLNVVWGPGVQGSHVRTRPPTLRHQVVRAHVRPDLRLRTSRPAGRDARRRGAAVLAVPAHVLGHVDPRGRRPARPRRAVGHRRQPRIASGVDHRLHAGRRHGFDHRPRQPRTHQDHLLRHRDLLGRRRRPAHQRPEGDRLRFLRDGTRRVAARARSIPSAATAAGPRPTRRSSSICRASSCSSPWSPSGASTRWATSEATGNVVGRR